MANDHPYYTRVIELLEQQCDSQFKPNPVALRTNEQQTKAAMARNMVSNRKLANLPQAKVAKHLGVSLSQYKKYEAGTETMRLDVAHKWSLLFCLPVFHLLQGSEFEEHLPSIRYEKELNYLWYLANSLTDEYFSFLLQILMKFSEHDHVKAREFKYSGITKEKINQVYKENSEEAYVAVAYGIRALRDFYSLSQEALAELVEISLSTYQEYEKPVPFPRFSVLVAARFNVTTQIDPLLIVGATHFAEVRKMQNARLELVREIIEGIDPVLFLQIRPLIDGFAKSVKRIPDAQIIG